MQTSNHRLLLVLVLLFVFVAGFQVSVMAKDEANAGPAKSDAAEKKVTVDFKDTKLKEVCAELSKSTGLPITCGSAFDAKTVTLSLKDAKLDEVLSEIAKQTGTFVNAKDGGFRFRHSAK